MNPYSVVDELERRLSDWCGSKYAIALESGTAAILLSLMYRKKEMGNIGTVIIPSKTYPSVPCSILHAGGKVKFVDLDWSGQYELGSLRIWDAALRFKRGMYDDSMKSLNALVCGSMHIKKHLQVGRGGFILTDDKNAYEWLRLARFDGREPIPLNEQKEFKVIGWNAYLEPSQAARAIQLFEVLKQKHPEGKEDLVMEEQQYADLSKHQIYTQ